MSTTDPAAIIMVPAISTKGHWQISWSHIHLLEACELFKHIGDSARPYKNAQLGRSRSSHRTEVVVHNLTYAAEDTRFRPSPADRRPLPQPAEEHCTLCYLFLIGRPLMDDPTHLPGIRYMDVDEGLLTAAKSQDPNLQRFLNLEPHHRPKQGAAKEAHLVD